MGYNGRVAKRVGSDPPSSYRLAALILAVLGAGFVLLITSRYGPGVNPDSVAYIGGARRLAASELSRVPQTLPHPLFAPLYTLLLALAAVVWGADPLSIAQIMNAILYGLIIYASAVLAHRIVPLRPVILFLITAAILVAGPLSRVSVMVLSEALFILLVLLALICADSYLRKEDRGSLWLLATAVALAALTRYIGVTLLLWGALVILLFVKESGKKKARDLLQFLVIALVPVGLWVTRNYVVSGTLTGARHPTSRTLLVNLSDTANTLRNWYIPPSIRENGALLAVLVIATLILLAAGAWLGRARIDPPRIGPLVLFVAVFAGFLVISATTTAFDVIGTRLLSPLFIPATLLLFYAAWLAAGSLGSPAFAMALLAALAAGFLFWSATQGAEVLYAGREFGFGFNDRRWRGSEMIAAIKEAPPALDGCHWYSNMHWALYVQANLDTGPAPRRTFHASTEQAADLAEVSRSWPEEAAACLAWFNEPNESLYSIAELRTVLQLEEIMQLRDGTIYRVTKARPGETGRED